ncbi:MAG: peptide chain release factor N(5)-glutamine methyltransferase [Verrucomicrobia bacterium]|nr:peptide chain release factor N(5)-glutamine methyltransferase [Verrucomicrobiota bacterium]RCL31101.1 MAG: peptide chain release factor N(5)-glutamine methyltransferase [Verrucomicrobiota bacterium]
MKTLLETLQSGSMYLEKRGVEDARLNMEHLTARVLGCSRIDLYLSYDRPLEEKELSPLREYIKRRGSREPLQYILGDVEFMGKKFFCDRRALIPRPETEELIGVLAARYESIEKPKHICDVGCGSGVIGISLAYLWNDSLINMIDLSEDALQLSRENIKLSGISLDRFNVLKSNLLSDTQENFDLIVSNLPYIESKDIELLDEELKHEPKTALDGGSDGITLIKELISQSKSLLLEGGMIALEIGDGQAETVSDVLLEEGYKKIESLKDISQIDRFVVATL